MARKRRNAAPAKRNRPAQRKRSVPFASERARFKRDYLEQTAFDSGEPVRIESFELENYPQDRGIEYARRQLRYRVRHLGSVRVPKHYPGGRPKGAPRTYLRKRVLQAYFKYVGYAAPNVLERRGKQIKRGDSPKFAKPLPERDTDVKMYLSDEARRIETVGDADDFIDHIRELKRIGYEITWIGWSWR